MMFGMTQSLHNRTDFTIAKYLELEAKADGRHEFHNGEILAMAGGTDSHSAIIVNVAGELRNRLRGKPCRAFESNLSIYIPEYNNFVYPDVSVICGPLERAPHDRESRSATNPRVIVEVAPDNASRHERGTKLRSYISLSSLQQCVLIDQDQARVEVLTRQPNGWLHSFYNGLDAVAPLQSIGIELPLAEVYLNVEFPPPRPRGGNALP
jgi:Uma2 family endonuclease